MRLNIPRLSIAALQSVFLIVPLTIAPSLLRADDKTITFHDKKHNDDHQWNAREEQAYRIYWTEKQRPYANFPTLHEKDQQAYWDWRHNHSDALLKIDVK